MEEYKVKYQLLGAQDQVTDWMVKPKAKKFFDKLKKDSKCIWAELLYSSLDEDAEESFYGEEVVEQFTKRVVEVLGIEMVMPLQEA